jgi:inorganic pyrophosphatase
MQNLHCYVEIPKGSHNRYAYDAELGGIRLERFLFASIGHPADCGFIPETLGDDGRPLAAVVCVSERTFPGCVIVVRAVAVLRLRGDDGEDVRIVCVPLDDPAWSEIEDVGDLPGALRDEIGRFFVAAGDLDGRTLEVAAWDGREAAAERVDEGRRRHRER